MAVPEEREYSEREEGLPPPASADRETPPDAPPRRPADAADETGAPTSDPPHPTAPEPLEDSLGQLRDLLLQPEMSGLEETRELIKNIQRDLHDPEHIAQMLLPVIDKVLSRKVAESRNMVAKAIAPIIDSAIREQIRQDEGSLTTTLAPIIGDMIRTFAADHPGELAESLHPVVLSSARRHLRHRMRRFVYRWDERIRRIFLLGHRRTSRADRAGRASEDEGAYLPDAVYLLHRKTGARITQAIRKKSKPLSDEMTEELLASVHAHVQKATQDEEDPPKIPMIPFGESTAIVEMGDACYAALLMHGDVPTPSYLFQVQQALTNIEHHNHKILDTFEPGATRLSGNITRILQNLLGQPSPVESFQKSSRPTAFITAAVLAALALLGAAGWYGYLAVRDLLTATTIRHAWQVTPSLANCELTVRARGPRVGLHGWVPTPGLRAKAVNVARTAVPAAEFQNDILAVGGESVGLADAGSGNIVTWATGLLNLVAGLELRVSMPDADTVTVRGRIPNTLTEEQIRATYATLPGIHTVHTKLTVAPVSDMPAGSVAAEVNKLSAVLNLLEDISIEPRVQGGNVILEGTVNAANSKPRIERAFGSIPGVHKVTTLLRVAPGAGRLADMAAKLAKLDAVLNVMEGIQLVSSVEKGEVVIRGKIQNALIERRIANVYIETLDLEAVALRLEVAPAMGGESVIREVARTTRFLNMFENVQISAAYKGRVVTIDGTVRDSGMTERIQKAYTQIPGVDKVAGTVRLLNVALAIRVHFDLGSDRLKQSEIKKISEIREILNRFPEKRLRIIGFAEIGQDRRETNRLALDRAKAVQEIFVGLGITTSRLQVEEGSLSDLYSQKRSPGESGRFVRFRLVE